MIQAAILILSAAAMWLVSGRSRHARLGWALGLVSQPFWLWETWLHEQYGMFTEPAVFVDDVRQRWPILMMDAMIPPYHRRITRRIIL